MNMILFARDLSQAVLAADFKRSPNDLHTQIQDRVFTVVKQYVQESPKDFDKVITEAVKILKPMFEIIMQHELAYAGLTIEMVKATVQTGALESFCTLLLYKLKTFGPIPPHDLMDMIEHMSTSGAPILLVLVSLETALPLIKNESLRTN